MAIKKEAFNRDNVDSVNNVFEKDTSLSWSSDPVGSYVYYDCTVGVMLDSGIVVHNRLPQVNKLPDSLSSVLLDDNDMGKTTNKGVNIVCQDQFQDIIQRMGHARYWFRLWGQALRVGYQIPIPGIKTIGGVVAIPYDKNPQWAYNSICPGGNYGGVILWRAMWSLWYTTILPPFSQTIPAADPTTLITGTPQPPVKLQAPLSQPDDNAQSSQPTRQGPTGTIALRGK